MVVPQLDHRVFTPGPARDYVGHALEIAKMYPDYAKQFQQAQAAEIARKQALLKYETDSQKAQAFLDMYPAYRDAQIAELQARANQRNAMAPMYAAHAALYGAKVNQALSPADDAKVKEIVGGGHPPPPLGTEDAPVPVQTPVSPTRTDAPPSGVDDSTLTAF